MNIFTEETKVPSGQCFQLQIGALTLWVINEGTEWHTSFEHGQAISPTINTQFLTNKPVDKKWQRWAINTGSGIIKVEPSMPDRAVVIRPEFTLQIPQNHTALFFIGIPLWVRVYSQGKVKTLIFQQPVIQLSNIWFGEMETGLLAYSLNSVVRDNWQSFDVYPFKAICPFQIKNRSEVTLVFKRACLQVKNLSIYNGARYLWANKINLKFVGEDRASEIHIESKPPDFESIKSTLYIPTEEHDTNKVINTFRNIAQLNWF